MVKAAYSSSREARAHAFHLFWAWTGALIVLWLIESQFRKRPVPVFFAVDV